VTDPHLRDFILELRPRLRAYLFYAGAHDEDVEDLVQEVLDVAVRRWRRISRHPRPVAYCLTAARNLWRTRVRRRSTERRVLDHIARWQPASEGPEEVAIRDERGRAIRTALAALPEREREAVVGKVWGGLTWVEIGRQLGVSDDTAARLFTRGVSRLKPKLLEHAET
jgi:RNA polymerase sigma-70 factor (ECF subfamily)